MADSYLGPPLSLRSSNSHFHIHNFPFPCSLLLSFPPPPFSRSLSSSFSFSFMAPVNSFLNNSAHCCHCSSASTTSTANNCASNQTSLLVFSGGTAFNGVVEELKNLTTRVAHVLPVSDDGGSTAEIVRVLGGPAVGDIRSRCLRLSDQSTSEALAVRTLLGHRLPLEAQKAKSEWYAIVEGNHSLWMDVSKPYRETIRAFLVYFQDQVLRRSEESFCFSNGSIGNFFFAGARIFFQSLDAAIFLFSRVSEIPSESQVLPVISTNDRLTLGCELLDGTIIRGQNEISHPTNGSMEPVNKVFPNANPTVLEQLRSVDCIIFAMGSLFTSICPSLVLLGIGEIISSRTCPKVLLLNGTHDRETSGLTASCFVTAISDALNRSYGDPHNCLKNPPNEYINTIFVPKGCQIPVDIDCLAAQGIFHMVTVDSVHDSKGGILFDPKSLIQALANLLTGFQRKNVHGI
ncbi:uncharacterized protein LOC111370542 isoform X2 [Olea europaea var. sylvestris]|uniref:uncharacterized protein LOC111370542 isoform X2 n=1 Tax=Olea europaea var. sylvestris TaxID=158386 RepID=UPI000C1CD53E|nr:uncharacterized protein LOC111370542 isoform X2 [Olea europaea var. sylvestris]